MNRIFKKSFAIIILLFFLGSTVFSQLSDLGRFEINSIGGCLPTNVEIINEYLDSTVTVIQYDFNYSLSTNIFNPSNSKSHTYIEPGTYTIAQAINQDGVEKIDILEIEINESKKLEINIFNCENNTMNISINDNNYEGYELFINNQLIKSLNNGENKLDYSLYLGTNNIINGYIIGSFKGNSINCSRYEFEIASIEDLKDQIIDSIILSNDKATFELYCNLNKSTNYNIYIDNAVDTSFLSPPYFNSLWTIDSKIEFKNTTINAQCINIEEYYYCNSLSIKDDICLIYATINEDNFGIKLNYNSNGSFDSLSIYKNNKPIKTTKNSTDTFLDNQGVIKSEENCYFVKGFINNKISISNIVCLIPQKNYNPIPIPNAFTPNNDGLNDIFKPYPISLDKYSLNIFNKFGKLIFESNDISIGWNGVYKSKVKQDSYIYKITFIINGKEITQTGKFVLIK
jgi:gliding motility-associated-like protein